MLSFWWIKWYNERKKGGHISSDLPHMLNSLMVADHFIRKEIYHAVIISVHGFL